MIARDIVVALTCVFIMFGIANGLELVDGLKNSWFGNSLFSFGMIVLFGMCFLMMGKKEKVPAGYKLPPVYASKIPLIGNFIGFARDPLGFVTQGRKECGQCFTIDMIAEKCTFLIGAEAHAAFFEATDATLDMSQPYQFMTPIFGKGIVYDCPLEKRRQQLRALGSCLKPSLLKTYPPIIAKETKAYLESHWGDEGCVDLHKVFAELIIMTASATLLGPEIRGEMFDEMSHLYELLDKGLTPLSIFFPYLPTTAHANRDKARVAISKLFSKVLDRRRNDPESSSNKNDMIDKLMKFQYSDGTKFTDDEICGMILAALFAGQHTSSITSTWSLLFLLEDAKKEDGGEWMNRVLDEIALLEPEDNVFAKGEGLDHATILQEKDMHSVIKESIRMFPPIIMLMRRVLKPISLPDGTYIPAGHRAMVSNAIAQRLPEVFENPDTWDPSRWEDFNIAKLPRYSFIGFGSGLHTCMGEPFAFMQVRTILTVMLSMYEMELTTPFPEPDYTAMVVPPSGPNMVKFKRRKVPLRVSRKVSPEMRKRVEEERKKREEEGKARAADGSSNNNDDEDVLVGYTVEEIAKHNTKESLWVIMNDKVYDVTNYIDIHQGGDEAILRWGGKDATKAILGDQHPPSVAQLITRYEIGVVVPGYTKEQVAKHNNKDSLWVISNNQVYDVTEFLQDHPGGESVILRLAGKDATKQIQGPQHPDTVPKTLSKYLIGKIV